MNESTFCLPTISSLLKAIIWPNNLLLWLIIIFYMLMHIKRIWKPSVVCLTPLFKHGKITIMSYCFIECEWVNCILHLCYNLQHISHRGFQAYSCVSFFSVKCLECQLCVVPNLRDLKWYLCALAGSCTQWVLKHSTAA